MLKWHFLRVKDEEQEAVEYQQDIYRNVLIIPKLYIYCFKLC